MNQASLLCLALSLGCSYSVVVGETPGAAGDTPGPSGNAGASGDCPAANWTNGSLCEPRFSLLCEHARITVVEDSSAAENASAHALAQALATSCGSADSVRITNQADASALDPSSGRPLTGPGELSILIGGPERQAGLAFMQQHAAAMRGQSEGTGYYLTSPEGDQAGGLNPVGADADLVAVQTLFEPTSQSVVLSIFGQREEGSVAGVDAFIADLPAQLASRTWWFTLNWQDVNGDLMPDASDDFFIGTKSGT